MSGSFRIAHMSDLHVPLGYPAGREWTLKAALSAASWHLKRRKIHRPEITEKLLEDMKRHTFDLVAMTGDLVNFGSEAEFRKGSDFLKQIDISEPMLCMPGNHEMMTRRSAQHMRTHSPAFSNGNDDPEFPMRNVFGRVAIITVSTAIPTPLGFASGEVGPGQRDRLTRMLRDACELDRYPSS